ncbi:DUF3102 domain-containing protein [Pectinatus frisingensis]|uniref:DUF3102 domain-containing protein n=1 Tax=Pectinatus frisingensis TaxID=865 RepID=UPI0018C55CE5|nr:DUF3102 domain-containing protein [Pectinatus frisingensis]
MSNIIDVSAKAVKIRTPEIIAAEINSIKRQVQQAMLNASIDIGRKLIEAQAIVEKGHWGAWLKENVDYSERTANNLIRIFKEYGALGQQELFDAPAKPEFEKLSYTQAVALLGLPTEDARADFIANNDIDSMSTRDLQAAVKAQKDAEERADDLQKRLDDALKEQSDQQSLAETANIAKAEEIKNLNGKIEELQKQLKKGGLSDEERAEIEKVKDALQIQVNTKDAALTKALKKVEKTEKKLQDAETALKAEKEKPLVIPETTKKEMEYLRTQLSKAESAKAADKAVIQIKVSFEMLKRDINDIISTLDKIEDKTTADTYKGKIAKLADIIKNTVMG